VRALISGRDVDDEVGGVAPEALQAAAELLSEGPLTVVVGRANLAESGRSIAAAAATIHHTLPDVRFLSALRRANVHGALELGLAPGLLPGRVTLEAGREWFADRWPKVPGVKGHDTAGILRAAADGKIDTLVLLGADPLADFPDRDLAERGLAGARTVIALAQFLTESVKQAEVVLPVAGYAEVSGTTTNLEGRVSALAQMVTPPGTAQSDWIVAADLAARLGFDLGVESVAQLAAEIEDAAPAFSGLTAEVLASATGRDGVVVMLPTRRSGNGAEESAAAEAAPEEPVVDQEETEGATAVAEIDDAVVAAESNEGTTPELEETLVLPPTSGVPLPVWTIIDPPSVDAYSLRLVVTRKLYDRGTLVRSSPSLSELAEPATLRLHPQDFDRLGVGAGDDVRITSTRGNVTVPTVPDAGVPRGVAHLYANRAGGRANVLIDGNAPITDVRVERP
jgi:NADH-quinone oxidoreductase subunit G